MATIDIAVDPSNRAAFQAWNGSEGDHWVDNDELYEAGLAWYGSIFFAAADIRPGDRVLDVGCGNGSTTCEAARRAAYGSALGVDLSARMIERGRHRAVAAGLVAAILRRSGFGCLIASRAFRGGDSTAASLSCC
jgi:cyclopropane fatty-acyl-phospholipid synthase-like methyltransferase